MDTHPIQVKIVFDNIDKTIEIKTHFNTKDFDSVIDKCVKTIKIFPNTIHINNRYAITPSDIDNTMFIPTPKIAMKKQANF